MDETRPTYKELKQRLEMAEKLIARLHGATTDASGIERNIAENERDIAESERDIAETERDNAEDKQRISDGERDGTALRKRDAAEKKRDAAEEKRDAAEDRRNSGEHTLGAAKVELDSAMIDGSKLKEAYIESEENFRNTIDASPLGIRVITADGDLFYANQAILDITGCETVEELKTIPKQQLYTPESYAGHLERKDKRRRGEFGPPEYEISIRRPDGEVRTLQVLRREITWGGERQYMAMYQDITDRLKAEEELTDLNTRQEAILAAVPDIIMEVNAEKIYSWANRAGMEFFGDDVIGKEADFYFEGEQKTYETVKPLFTGNEDIIYVQSWQRRRDGEKRLLAWWCRVLKDENNKVTGALSSARDITDQLKAEEALKESEDKYRSIVEQALIGIGLSKGNQIIFANKALLTMLKYDSLEEYLKVPLLDQIAASSRYLIKERLKRVTEGKVPPTVFEYDGLCKDGTIKNLHVSSTYVTISGEIYTQTIFQDNTDRKKAEAALKESQERFFGAFHYSPSMNIIINRKTGKCVEVNDAFCFVTGYNREETMGKTEKELDIWYETEQRETILKELFEKGFVSNIEIKLKMKDGTVKIFNTNLAVLILGNEPYIFMSMIDMTKRKAIEAALAASEERYRTSLDNMIEGCQIIDRDWRYLYVNEATCRQSRMEKSDLVGRKIVEIYPGVEKTGMFASMRKCMDERIPQRMETDYTFPDGTTSWFDLSVQPVPEGIFVLALEITERRQAELAVHQSEERFRRIFQAGPLGIVLSNLDHKFTMANTHFYEMYGYSEAELRNMTYKDLTFPEDVYDTPAKLDALVKGSLAYFNVERRYRKKNGEVFWGNLTITLLRDNEGNPRGFLSMVQDVTSRKEDEERINHLNLALRSIRNINQLITREKDRDRLIQGVCDNLVVGRSFHSVWIILLDDARQPVTWAETNTSGMNDMVDLFRRGELPRCVQKAISQKKVVVTKDPQEQCRGCPVLGQTKGIGSMTVRLELNGTLYGVLCGSMRHSVLIDDEEISLFSEIAADVTFALRDIELGSTKDLLQQEQLRAAKLESIGTLAGGIAHDFNNLLTGIMGNIGLAKSYLPPTEEVYEMLDEAEKAAIRSRDLTQQLLTFARGGKPIKKVADITGVIKDAAAFALRGSKIRLELSLPEDLWLVDADEGQISQVIHNLVSNADEAMPQGGTLQIKARNLNIKRSGTLPLSSGNYIQIDVCDTGTGIQPEHLHKIFEPYFTTKAQGSGLGLTSAYSIIKSHGGSLLAESVPNQGSIFHVYLPASRKMAKGEKKVDIKKSTQAGGKVLVMDDDEIIRKMLKNMLNLAGYEVETSADGAEALEKYKQAMDAQNPYSVVIMDLTVPGGMGGKEATKKLLEIDPAASVIVSSGYATDPIMSEYKKYGFAAVIAKPYSIKQLQETLTGLPAKKKK